MSLLESLDPGKCADLPGASHQSQAGSGLVKRRPKYGSVGGTSGFNWFQVVTGTFENLPSKFVHPQCFTQFWVSCGHCWAQAQDPKENTAYVVKTLDFIKNWGLEGKQFTPGHTANWRLRWGERLRQIEGEMKNAWLQAGRSTSFCVRAASGLTCPGDTLTPAPLPLSSLPKWFASSGSTCLPPGGSYIFTRVLCLTDSLSYCLPFLCPQPCAHSVRKLSRATPSTSCTPSPLALGSSLPLQLWAAVEKILLATPSGQRPTTPLVEIYAGHPQSAIARQTTHGDCGHIWTLNQGFIWHKDGSNWAKVSLTVNIVQQQTLDGQRDEARSSFCPRCSEDICGVEEKCILAWCVGFWENPCLSPTRRIFNDT